MTCRELLQTLFRTSLDLERHVLNTNSRLMCVHYRMSSSQSKEKQEKIKISAESPRVLKNDWIGPPDPASNLRPVKFYVPPDETQLERSYREKRQEVWDWNQEFWEQHNKAFFKQKEEFIKENLAKKKADNNGEDEASQSLSQEELSVFYRRFLNNNYRSHIFYNKEWYKKNISLLWPALQINLSRIFKNRKQNSKT